MSICGFQAVCGRQAGHDGQHKRWRGVAVIAAAPVDRGHPWAPLGTPLTTSEVRCLAEFLYHGDQAKAATCLDIAHHTFKVHISNALARTGAVSSIQVARLLGWVEFPEGSMRHMAAR